jgi:Protein of unknown function (DUF2852)
MYTAPNAAPTVNAKEGLMAWAKGAERWLDDRGKKAWIFATILGFIFAWPVGLGLLAYMIWSKRMFNRSCGHSSSERGGPWARHGRHNFGSPFRSSGNAAFDAYKAETIRRLQEEQDAFEAFLQRLRDAKDKSEFDTFMADRAQANAAASAPITPAAADTLRSGEY